MAIKRLSLVAAIALTAMPAWAQFPSQWNSTHLPGSPFTTYTGPNGWSGQTTQLPGSPFSNTTINGPYGEMRTCQTTHLPGSPFASMTCN